MKRTHKEIMLDLYDFVVGKDGCNFRMEKGKEVWNCKGTQNLEKWCADNNISYEKGNPWPTIDGEYCNGVGCDCEFIFNFSHPGWLKE